MNINTSNISKAVMQSIFQSQTSVSKKEIEVQNEDFKQEDINLIDTKLNKNINVAEIQKYAQNIGETVTIDDINYGITYGRSVIADYFA